MKSTRFFMVWVLAACALSSGCGTLSQPGHVQTGQHPQSFQRQVETMENVNYLLYVPETYATSAEPWPLLLFLHGAGERGDELSQVAVHGPPRQAQDGKALPFIVVSPQCPQDGWWANPLQLEGLDALLDDIISRYRIDEQRVYVTGLSMGGFGSWSLAAAYPDRFAAMAPICGGGDPKLASRIAHIPTWVFHGGKDEVVRPEQSEEMVNALKAAGGDVTFTLYPDAGHDSWTQTYEDPALYPWLLGHSRSTELP